jgi:glycosyltransferase involved in cell wall biosynthesis
MHRDWETLLSAFGDIDGYEVRIGSSKTRHRQTDGLRNVKLISATNGDEVRALYDWSDFVVIPLKPNLHASRITVLLEAIASGVPTICTDTGGLRAYFSDVEVAYVPPFAPIALRTMVDGLCTDEDRRFAMIAKAQERMIAADLTAQGFATRNRRLSEELLRSSSRATIDASSTDYGKLRETEVVSSFPPAD